MSRWGARSGVLLAVAASVLAACTHSSPAPTAGSITISSAPAPVQTTPVPAPTAGSITFYLRLPARTDSLSADAMAVATPGNRSYRHFRSVPDLAAAYGATTDTARSVTTSLSAQGLNVAVDPTGLFARVSGTPAQWSAALQAPLEEQPSTAANPFTAFAIPRRSATALLPPGTSWLFTETTVYDPTTDGHRPTRAPVRTPGPAPSGPTSAWPLNTGNVGSGVCTQPAITDRAVYVPAQVQQAYGVTGMASATAGTTPDITVIDLGGGWSAADLAAAGSCFGYGSVHVDQEQGDGVPTAIANVDPETSLDLQTVASVAPKASIRLVQASDGPAAMLDGFSRALADPRGIPDVISLSYGGCALADAVSATAFAEVTDEVLAMTSMAGASTFVAAGDSGSTTCSSVSSVPTLSYPAVSPFVTAVGGTRLALTSANARAEEVVWNDLPYGEPAAGGGGLALREPTPAYQRPFNNSGRRAVPDVSALADIVPGWPVFLDGTLQPVGGTSGSSPFTAAATALLDARLRGRKQPRIGLANGWLYKARQDAANTFYDVTQGSNELKPVNCCDAAPGYDPASGLGVPNWSALPATLPSPGA